jgi:hypothetical protein
VIEFGTISVERRRLDIYKSSVIMDVMKTTKLNVQAFVKHKLATDPVWALKALVRIFTENQTQSEQQMDATVEDNGIGFSGVDAEFMSSLAKQYIAKGFLSPKQMSFVFKKISKYSRQVVLMSNQDQLKKMVEAAT